jgi:hypothetical protein
MMVLMGSDLAVATHLIATLRLCQRNPRERMVNEDGSYVEDWSQHLVWYVEVVLTTGYVHWSADYDTHAEAATVMSNLLRKINRDSASK